MVVMPAPRPKLPIINVQFAFAEHEDHEGQGKKQRAKADEGAAVNKVWRTAPASSAAMNEPMPQNIITKPMRGMATPTSVVTQVGPRLAVAG